MKKTLFTALVLMMMSAFSFYGCTLESKTEEVEKEVTDLAMEPIDLTFTVGDLLNQRQEGIAFGVQGCQVKINELIDGGVLVYVNPDEAEQETIDEAMGSVEDELEELQEEPLSAEE